MIERWVPSGSSYAADIDFVFSLIFWIVIAFWFVAAELAFFWLIMRFRKKDGHKAEYITGELHHEKKWIEYPHYAIILCDIVILYFAVTVWYDVKQNIPPVDRTVGIVAQQWAWTFVHPGADGQLGNQDDIRTVEDLHLEVGKTYKYELISQDVLHSLSIPVFRLKQDAIPGRIVTGWFKPTLEGDFDLQCAEICGIGHALMPARVHVENAAAHQAWIESVGPVAVASPAEEEPAADESTQEETAPEGSEPAAAPDSESGE